MIQREADFATIQESSTCIDNAKISKASSSSTTSWSRLKDPRIVRVSRAFGGKDRHSKVCTVRGLRDRRVRLSVPTAIQLYDLQDRLGLNQPSKVVDWLLNAAKHEIDELPPLQIPQGGFSHNLQTSLEFGASPSNKQGPKISGSANWNDTLKSSRSNIFWGKSKDVSGEASDHRDENWARNEEERQYNMENQGAYVSTSSNCFTRQIPSSLPSFLNSTTPYNPFVRWDPSNLTLSQPTRSHGLTDQTHHEDLHNFSLMPVPSTLSVPSGSHQVLVYQPSAMATQSYFPSQIAAMNAEFDPKQLNYSQLSNSSLTSSVNTSTTQPVRTFHFSMTANLLPSQNNAASGQHKNNEFHLG